MTGRYDLHTHSVFSDGTTTPSEIAAHAAKLGLAGFALTDHDTVRGWDEARAAAQREGLEFLPGMEITTRHDWRSTHLLAYGLNPDSAPLQAGLLRVRESRISRAQEMVDRLSADFNISWNEVSEDGERTIGRPHIADALVVRGYFTDRSEAFEKALHPRSPYYVPTYAIETVDAIHMVREAGGLAVLAHPAAFRQSRPVDADAIDAFAEAGLWGIELEHPENREDWLRPLRAQAEQLGLQVTGASDYHGAGKPNLLGERTSGQQVWEAIRERVAIPE